MEVLTVWNRGDRHGRTSHLSQGELADLAAFLMELEPEPEVAGMVDPGPLRGGRPVLAARRTCAGYLFTWEAASPWTCGDGGSRREGSCKARVPRATYGAPPRRPGSIRRGSPGRAALHR